MYYCEPCKDTSPEARGERRSMNGVRMHAGVLRGCSTPGTTLLILAGGRATRLGGVSKTMLHVGGRPILERIVHQLGPLATERLALVHDADPPPVPGLSLLTDVRPFPGPVAALADGLRHASGDVCMLVAGDMPFASRAAFAYLLRLQTTANAAVVVPYVDGRIESMHAVFRREELLAAIEVAQRDGEQRLYRVFLRLNPRLVDETELRQVDPEMHTLFNVNSPEDRALAEQIARTITTD